MAARASLCALLATLLVALVLSQSPSPTAPPVPVPVPSTASAPLLSFVPDAKTVNFTMTAPYCFGQALRGGQHFPWQATCEIGLNLTLTPPDQPSAAVSHTRNLSFAFSVAMPRTLWTREFDMATDPRTLLNEQSMRTLGGASLDWSTIFSGDASLNETLDFGNTYCDFSMVLQIPSSYDDSELTPYTFRFDVDFYGACSTIDTAFSYAYYEQREAATSIVMSSASGNPLIGSLLVLVAVAAICASSAL